MTQDQTPSSMTERRGFKPQMIVGEATSVVIKKISAHMVQIHTRIEEVEGGLDMLKLDLEDFLCQNQDLDALKDDYSDALETLQQEIEAHKDVF